MVNFGKAIRLQSNPSWVDEYVQYRRLKTIIKRLVFVWTHGRLYELPIKYDPNQPTLTLQGPQLIPPKMPTDDSDDEEYLDDSEHVSIASISVRPGAKKRSESMTKAGRDRQKVRDALSEGVRELAELEASEKEKLLHSQKLMTEDQGFSKHLHPSQQAELGSGLGSTSSTPLLHGNQHQHQQQHHQHQHHELATIHSPTPINTLSLSANRYGALDNSPFSPVDNNLPLSQLKNNQGSFRGPSSLGSPTGSTTSQQPKGLAKVLSFASFKSLFATAQQDEALSQPPTPLPQDDLPTSLTPAQTPVPTPPPHRVRKQQQAKLLFEQYQSDFWTILNEDFNRVESFYDTNVSRCTVAVHQMVQDAVGSYRHRTPGLEAAANAGLTRDEARFGAILAIYEQLIDLKAYCQLNVQGFRKILKKYEKYSPKIQRDVGQIISVTSQPCSKFMQRVRNSSFAMMEDLKLLIQQISNLVSRDKLLAIELQVQSKRSALMDASQKSSSGHGHESSDSSFRYGPCKLIPFAFSVALFFLILMLPINLDPDRFKPPVAPAPIAIASPTAIPVAPGASISTDNTTGVSSKVKALKVKKGLADEEPPTERLAIPNPIPVAPNALSHDGLKGHRAHNCFALLIFAIALWVTEAIPYFCTGLLIPVLVVLLDLAVDPNSGSGIALPAKQAASYVSSKMFDHTSLLVLLSFAISAAFSKAQFELRVASKFQAKLGSKPRLFILGIMFLCLFLSMWLGNKTSPILCIAFLLPVMQDYKHDSKFNRALMLGLTFAANIAGMITPIASLQNIVAVATLSKVGIDISFGQWLAVSVPLCCTLTFVCWVYIMYTIDPDDVDSIPLIAYDKRPMTSVHWLVMGVSGLTILLLAVPSLSNSTLGGIPTISLIYLTTVFSTGILTTLDINSFNWHLILLIGGGSVLGDVIKSSKLLDVLSSVILSTLSSNPMLAYFEIVFVIIVITSCISHTVGALILTPLIVKLGLSLGIPIVLTLTCAFAISGAMALPFSSFPNLNSAMTRDESGNSYLDPQTIMRAGIPFTMITYGFLITFGYVLIRVLLGS